MKTRGGGTDLTKRQRDRKKKAPAKVGRTAKPADATERTSEPAPPPTNEIELLGSRRRARRGNAIQVRADVTALRAVISKTNEREGEDAHEIGTQVTILYMKRADQIYGYESFVEFVRVKLRLSRSRLYRYLKVAKYATAAQARWGVDTCVAAGRLIELLRTSAELRRSFRLRAKPETISDLAGVKFPVADGRTIQLKGETLGLDDVEGIIAALGQAGGRNGARRLRRELLAANEALATGSREHPSLRGVETGFAVRKGRPVFELVMPASADLRAVTLAVLEILARQR